MTLISLWYAGEQGEPLLSLSPLLLFTAVLNLVK